MSELELQFTLEDFHEQKILLYLDSFDETGQRTNLIKDYIKLFNDDNCKVFITCRSDYVQDEGWFMPRKKNAFVRKFISDIEKD